MKLLGSLRRLAGFQTSKFYTWRDYVRIFGPTGHQRARALWNCRDFQRRNFAQGRGDGVYRGFAVWNRQRRCQTDFTIRSGTFDDAAFLHHAGALESGFVAFAQRFDVVAGGRGVARLSHQRFRVGRRERVGAFGCQCGCVGADWRQRRQNGAARGVKLPNW